MNLNGLQDGLHTKLFGKRIVFLRRAGSTNDVAKEFAGFGAAEGTVVIAESQTAGRGRGDRKWFSPKGGLYFSIVLRPKTGAKEAAKLVFMAGLAVAKTLSEIRGLKVETKWPNDVLVAGKKICGILSEMRTSGRKVSSVVIGVGINANFEVRKALPRRLAVPATSLRDELGRNVELERLFTALIEKLEAVHGEFENRGSAFIIDEWKKHASFLNQPVEVANQSGMVRGVALDVDNEGALVVQLENGNTLRFHVGEIVPLADCSQQLVRIC